MARHKKHNGKKSFTIPLAIVAGVAPGLGRMYSVVKAGGGVEDVTQVASLAYLGYDTSTAKMNLAGMRIGTLPIVLGFLVHKVAGSMGINSAIARAGIPILRI